MSSLFCVTIIVLLLSVLVHSEIKLNPNWVKPDIYSRERLSKSLKTDLENYGSGDDKTEAQIYQPIYNNEDLSSYYRKIVKFIIKKSKLKPFQDSDGASDDDYLIRTINFKISKKQIQQLENSDDILELDGIFSDIIHQSEGGVFNFLQDAVLTWSDVIMIKSAEHLNWNYVKFFAYISGMLLVSFQISKRFKMHIFLSILIVTGILRFFGEYQLCNKRKEYEKLASLSIRERNPCDLKVPSGLGDYINSFFAGNSKDECIKHLMEKFEPQIEFCDPLDVFLDFINNIIFKQISQFFVKLGESAATISAHTKFPYNILIIAFLLWVMKDLLITFVKLVFRYFFLARKHIPSFTPIAERPASHSRLLDKKIKQKIKKQLEKLQRIENRVEPLPEINDVSDVTDSETVKAEINPSHENVENEFEIVKIDKEELLESSTNKEDLKKEN